jgi:hypothetical protein
MDRIKNISGVNYGKETEVKTKKEKTEPAEIRTRLLSSARINGGNEHGKKKVYRKKVDGTPDQENHEIKGI